METPIINNVLPKNWESQLNRFSSSLDVLAEQADKIVIKLNPQSIKEANAIMKKHGDAVNGISQIYQTIDNQQKRLAATSKQTAQAIDDSFKKVGSFDISKPIDKLMAKLKEVRSDIEVYQELMYETKNTGRKVEIHKELEASNLEAEKLMRQIAALTQAKQGLSWSTNLTPSRDISDEGELQRMREYYQELERTSAKKKETIIVNEELTRTEKVLAATMSEKEAQSKNIITLSGKINAANTKEATDVDALKYSLKELNKIRELNLILQTSEAGSFNALSAEYRLNVMELNKYSQSQIEASTRLKMMQQRSFELREEMAKLKAATNDNTLRVGQYERALGSSAKNSNQAYYQTFQLTQVMRELPNFAIDARVGFMAISNNLPMLAEGFNNLARSTVEVTDAMGNVTTKTLGNMGALKQFGKSLLSLNTIMIAFSTIMMLLNNDRFTDWLDKLINKTSEAERVHKNYLKSLKDGSSVLKGTLESTTKVDNALKLYNSGLIDGKTFLSEFNKELGTTYGKQTDVNVAVKKFTELTPAYIQAMALQSEANTALDDAITKNLEARSLRENKSVNFFQKQAEGAKNLYILTKDLFGFSTKADKEYLERQENETNAVLRSRQEKAAKADKISEASRIRFNELSKQSQEILKANGLQEKENSDKTAKANEKSSKAEKERYEKAVFYSANRARVEQSLYELEQKLSKTAVDGTINDYNERDYAARSYYYAKLELLDIDRQEAIKNAEEELASDKSKKKDLVTAQQNYQNAILIANDEYNTKQIELANELSGNLLSIDSDRYADEVYLMKVSNDEKLRLIDEYAQTEKAKREKMTPSEIIASAFGVDTDSAFESLKLDNDVNQRKLEQNKSFIEDKLSVVQKGGEEEKQLMRELAEAEKEIEDAKRQYQLDSLDLIQEKTEEAYKEMAASIKQTISGLVDAYVEMGERQAEKESERLDKEKEEKLSRLDENALTEEAYKAEQDRLNREYDDKQKALEEEQKERKRNAFLFEQGLALASVWIKLAQANAEAIAVSPLTFGQPWVGVNTATAIAQTALIAAQTIPAFAEGGEQKETGLALVGDGGKHELLMYPNGKIGITPDTNTLMTLPKGTTIYPDAEHLPSFRDIEKKIIVNSIFNSKEIVDELRILVSETRRKPKMIEQAQLRRQLRQ